MANPLARAILQKNLNSISSKQTRGTSVERTIDKKTIDNREINIISGLIKGEKAVVENIKNNRVLTLDEAAEIIKNNR